MTPGRLLLGWVALVSTSSLLMSCESSPVTTASSPNGLVIEFLNISAEHLVGAEYFDVTLSLPRPAGQYISHYGLRTPFEDTMTELKPPLPMPIQNGYVVLRKLVLTKVPRIGPYPVDFWVVSDTGQVSNHISYNLDIQ